MAKQTVEWTIVLLGICGLSGTSSNTCENGIFWEQCHGNELCVCSKENWYQLPKNEVQNVGNICSCPVGTLLDSCPNDWHFGEIMKNSEINKTLVLRDEETCRQLLTRESTTYPSTEKQETTFVTAINEHTTQNEASSVGESTTYPSTEKQETTFVTAINEHTTQDEASSVAMCPCSCEYFDKIDYWSQEANQIKQYKELSQQLANIENMLKMEKKNLTSYLNKKRSADDKRPSAHATGYVGAVILVLILSCIVMLDIVRCPH